MVIKLILNMPKRPKNNYYEELEVKLLKPRRIKNKMKVSGASVKKLANIIRKKLSK